MYEIELYTDESGKSELEEYFNNYEIIKVKKIE